MDSRFQKLAIKYSCNIDEYNEFRSKALKYGTTSNRRDDV